MIWSRNIGRSIGSVFLLVVAICLGSASLKAASSGTGFFVSESGHLVTNAHVVDGCLSILVKNADAGVRTASLILVDRRNDLALMRVQNPPKAVAVFTSEARLGQAVYAFGFPLAGLLSSSGNFTAGSITAVSGLNDDTRIFQISTPVQPGNSGGPLLNSFGKVVGVIVGKLNALAVTSVTNDIPQNVNFAIKASVVQSFLRARPELRLPPHDHSVRIAPPDIAELATRMSVMVRCVQRSPRMPAPSKSKVTIRREGNRQEEAQKAPSMWEHNGSVMYLVAAGRSRRFYYAQPRAGVRVVGVKQNTLLFDGNRIGSRYTGTAYFFTKRCGRIPYKVEGSVSPDHRTVVMVGRAPRLNRQCQPIGSVRDTLSFQLMDN